MLLTGNTNGGNFELFSAVADAEGSGIPLAFLLMRTSKEAASGAKEAVLKQFLRALKSRGVNPEFTLSDKDWSEINAMRATWPNAKHQLCFWHALRALKQRLSKTKDTPAVYDAVSAKREFDFIDTSFVPAAQQADGLHERVSIHRVTALAARIVICPIVSRFLHRLRNLCHESGSSSTGGRSL